MSGSTIKELAHKQLIPQGGVPSWLPEAIQYEVIMGSFAYGVSSDTSDVDLYGFAIPDKQEVFPHLAGYIDGFDKRNRFEVWQMHHIKAPDELGGRGREYDCQIYSIVKYFALCMQCNPNMIDSLFVPQRCILFSTPVGVRVREARRQFLHKRCWHTFKGYAYQQVHKMMTKNPEGKRREIVDKYGFDVKFGYHVVRLLNEVEQILTEGDLDLERNNEQLKSIRRGEWTAEQVKNYFTEKEKSLEQVYLDSKLPWGPDEAAIKELLIDCLEQHFGSLNGAVVKQDVFQQALRAIKKIIERLGL